MSELTITGEIRKSVGKGNRALRREGKVPGIYYGHGLANIAVAV